MSSERYRRRGRHEGMVNVRGIGGGVWNYHNAYWLEPFNYCLNNPWPDWLSMEEAGLRYYFRQSESEREARGNLSLQASSYVKFLITPSAMPIVFLPASCNVAWVFPGPGSFSTASLPTRLKKFETCSKPAGPILLLFDVIYQGRRSLTKFFFATWTGSEAAVDVCVGDVRYGASTVTWLMGYKGQVLRQRSLLRKCPVQVLLVLRS